MHWFGTALPSVGIALKVGLVNMHELRARWMAVGGPQAGATPPVGPNLTEPLLGAGGTLAGIFASPLNGILLTHRDRVARRHVVGEDARGRELADRRAADAGRAVGRAAWGCRSA